MVRYKEEYREGAGGREKQCRRERSGEVMEFLREENRRGRRGEGRGGRSGEERVGRRGKGI